MDILAVLEVLVLLVVAVAETPLTAVPLVLAVKESLLLTQMAVADMQEHITTLMVD
jgi:hypothetical protein